MHESTGHSRNDPAMLPMQRRHASLTAKRLRWVAPMYRFAALSATVLFCVPPATRATTTHYVSPSGNSVAPYLTWADAATNIQDAVDAAATNDVVLVTNGVYAGGGVAMNGVTNRVYLTNNVSLRSVNGPAFTFIVGAGPIGSNAVRCVFMTGFSSLSGFTITNGHTALSGASYGTWGGGVYCDSPNAGISNCVITGNASADRGGGVFGGALRDCVLSGNKAVQGGGYAGYGYNATNRQLDGCTIVGNAATNYGGGIFRGNVYGSQIISNSAGVAGGVAGDTSGGTTFRVEDCVVQGNTATNLGGGIYKCVVRGSLVIGNSAFQHGGGIANAFNVQNCTVCDNFSPSGSGIYSGSSILSSIIYFNTPESGQISGGGASYSCSPSLTSGSGNITNDPEFVDRAGGNYRLSYSSPCIDAGQGGGYSAFVDLDGNPRVVGPFIDMGAYETPFVLNVSLYLQGPYDTNTHEMTVGLATNNLIPLTSPYAADVRTVSAIPTDATDWVLVQLRTNLSGAAVFSRSAFLRRDGLVIRDDGSTGIVVDVSRGNSDYIVVSHRNHESAISLAPVPFTNALTSFDFASSPYQTLDSTNALAAVDGSSAWALRSGDADGNGAVEALDMAIYETQTNLVGYKRSDFNLDGTVAGNDLDLYGTPNVGRQTSVPHGDVILFPSLRISPDRKTLVVGESNLVSAGETTGSVFWAFQSDFSGGTLVTNGPTSLWYQAGATASNVDVVAGWNPVDDRLNRTYVNVISAEDAAKLGKAIIVAGGKSLDDPVWRATDYVADRAYNVLRYRGYARDGIRYHSFDPAQDADGNGLLDDIYTNTSLSSVALTFTNWAADADRLFVYLADHGSDTAGSGLMRLNSSEFLAATNLNAWLDQLQAANTNMEITVVLDFCYSGSFLDEIASAGPPARIVVASANTNELTYFVASGAVSFSDVFFSGILQGLDVYNSFLLAQGAMSNYQHAVLDDDGNGVYQAGVDGDIATDAFVGASFIAGKDFPIIGSVAGPQVLTEGSKATLYADNIESFYPLASVRCTILAPSHNPDPESGVPVVNVPEVELAYDDARGRYEAEFDGFTESGTYLINYTAEDIWGSVSPPRIGTVEQNGYDERAIIVVGSGERDFTEYADALGDLYDGTGGGDDFSSATNLDIVSVHVENDATNLTFGITLNSAGFPSNGRYMVGLDSAPGGDTSGNGWSNSPISMAAGMDYWIACTPAGGGQVIVYRYQDPTWSAISTSGPPAVQVAVSNLVLRIPLTNLDLMSGDAVSFDVYSTFTTGGGGLATSNSAVDASSNPAITITNRLEAYDSGTNLSTYTVTPLPSVFTNIGRLAYDTFLARRIAASNIYYMSRRAQDADGDGTNDVDSLVTSTGLVAAVTNWANPSSKLTIYLTGETTNNSLRLNGDELLNGYQLGAALDAYQVSNRPVNVIMDFTSSGLVLHTNLVATNFQQRIVIASTRAGRQSLAEHEGTVSFSQYFLGEIFGGKTIGDAFTRARKIIRRVSGPVRQRAELDDNGNSLPNERNIDGSIAKTVYIGAGFVTGEDAPTIGSVNPPVVLVSSNEALLWADDVTDVDGISNVWVLITPPSFAGTGDLERVDLSPVEGLNRYEGTYTNFVATGSYGLTFYAEDNTTQRSAAVQSEAIKADPFENDDTADQAHVYSGAPEIHNFHASNDVDWVRFFAVSNYLYDIETFQFGARIDTALDLYRLETNGTLSLLDHLNDSGFDDGEYTGLDFPTNGWYYLSVSSDASYGFAPGSYDLLIEIPAGGGQLVVIAANKLDSAHAPPGAEATLDGSSNIVFGSDPSVTYEDVAAGSHVITVSAPAGYYLEEDPDAPDQKDNPDNPLYGNPQNTTSSNDEWRAAYFQFVPLATALGTVRDRQTGAYIDGAKIEFLATSGIISNILYDGYPNNAVYETQWFTRADGTFPTNVLLPTVDFDLTLTHDGYSNQVHVAAITNAVPGGTSDLGALYMAPLDTNGNGLADSWELLYFGPGTNVVPTDDTDMDGHNNEQEYWTGTDPWDPASVFKAAEVIVPNGFILTWPVSPGRAYDVLDGDSLLTDGWPIVAGPWTAAPGQTNMEYAITNDPAATLRAFTVKSAAP